MNSHEFFLWLNGYLEALESEGITECKIKNIRNKMGEIKPDMPRIHSDLHLIEIPSPLILI